MKKIIKIKNYSIIPLNEDSADMQEYGEIKKDKIIKRRKNQENERGKK